MRSEHHEAFYSAASHYHCWIGLREPNPLADKWFGRAGYMPKGKLIKPKTADQPDHPLAGLVVDPLLCPDAFRKASLERVRENWKIPEGGKVTKDGPEKGLLRVHGKAVFADYDLMCVTLADEKGNLTWTPRGRGNLLSQKVRSFLNRRMGVPMLQHGSEFQYKGLGAKEREVVLFYGPGRQFKQSISSMPKNGH